MRPTTLLGATRNLSFSFGGGVRDPTTGTIHFGARDYDPSNGRWTAKDPIYFSGESTNLYEYVGSDPINYVDPSGLLRWPSLDDIGNAFAGFGDFATFGLTRVVRRSAGWDDTVNPCSGWYVGGEVVGFLYPFALAKVIAGRAALVGGARAVRAGQRGEAAVRAVEDIGLKEVIWVGGRKRIPDGLTREVLTEVKNVRYLGYTRQLRDFAAFARQNGLRFELWIRATSRLSGPLLAEVASKAIRIRIIPLP